MLNEYCFFQILTFIFYHPPLTELWLAEFNIIFREYTNQIQLSHCLLHCLNHAGEDGDPLGQVWQEQGPVG